VLLSLLAIGFVLGLRHALDADHVAAVASLATRSASLRQMLRISAAWGLGHATTLIVAGGVLVLIGATVPDGVARVLEGAVGVMLVVLGIDVLRRTRTVRTVQVHAHPHDWASGRAPRALAVGCMHGLAGTGGLLLLAMPAGRSGPVALLYLLVFSLGTVLGMLLFSALISVPLAISMQRLRRAAYLLEMLLGFANLALGFAIAINAFV
jgi:cytochrome c biogenesis protein CcdA